MKAARLRAQARRTSYGLPVGAAEAALHHLQETQTSLVEAENLLRSEARRGDLERSSLNAGRRFAPNGLRCI
jgi:hypothetical protein